MIFILLITQIDLPGPNSDVWSKIPKRDFENHVKATVELFFTRLEDEREIFDAELFTMLEEMNSCKHLKKKSRAGWKRTLEDVILEYGPKSEFMLSDGGFLRQCLYITLVTMDARGW